MILRDVLDPRTYADFTVIGRYEWALGLLSCLIGGLLIARDGLEDTHVTRDDNHTKVSIAAWKDLVEPVEPIRSESRKRTIWAISSGSASLLSGMDPRGANGCVAAPSVPAPKVGRPYFEPGGRSDGDASKFQSRRHD